MLVLDRVARPDWPSSIAWDCRAGSCTTPKTSQLVRHNPLTLVKSVEASAQTAGGTTGVADHKRMRLLLRLSRITYC